MRAVWGAGLQDLVLGRSHSNTAGWRPGETRPGGPAAALRGDRGGGEEPGGEDQRDHHRGPQSQFWWVQFIFVFFCPGLRTCHLLSLYKHRHRATSLQSTISSCASVCLSLLFFCVWDNETVTIRETSLWFSIWKPQSWPRSNRAPLCWSAGLIIYYPIF